MRRYSIQTKIVLPFMLLFAVVAIVFPLVAVEIFAWKYYEQFTRETEGWFDTIIETGYFDEKDHKKLKRAYSVEIMIFGSDYTLNATTLDELSNVEPDWTNLADKMRLREVKPYLENPDGTSITRNVTLDGKPYKVFYVFCLFLWESCLQYQFPNLKQDVLFKKLDFKEINMNQHSN